MKKKILYSEICYILGILILAFGTAVMEKADFGVSMVVAPAYTLYLKMSQIYPAFTFGMAELALQFVLMLLLVILTRRFALSHVFSFCTVVVYGIVLDGSMLLLSHVSANSFALRLAFYLVGLVITSAGVSLLFHTYISPAVYEFFVKEVSSKYNLDIHRFKTVYDCISCLAAIIMSFVFFGFMRFEGVKLGTVFCALVNGTLIGIIARFIEKHFEIKDRLPLKGLFR